MSGRIEASNRRFGRVNLALKDIGNLTFPLNNVATHPILGYFLRKSGLATKLKTTTGSVYVNTNSLLSRLHSHNGIPAQLKKKTLSSIKSMIKSQGMTTSKTLDCSKIHGIYIKIQILKNPAFIVPLQNPAGTVQETAALSNTADAPSLANPTREIKEEGELLDGKRAGKWTITYPNGDREEGEYSEGERQGIWTTTYHNTEKGYVGFPKMKYENYAAGKIQKTTIGRINSSTLKKVENWVTTHENGDKVKKSYSHIDHRLDGPYIRTYANRKKISGNYQCGKKINDWLTTYPDGEKSLISYNLVGICVRVFKSNADGKITEDTNYKDAFRHGKWFKILANGTIENGQYAENRKEGLWRIQHHTGETDEIHYQLGFIQGVGVRIHQNGDREEGMYFAGVRWGIWITTDKDGNLKNTIEYKAGKIVTE